MLTSTARKHFLHTDQGDEGTNVAGISDAGFIGQPGHLQPFVTLHSMTTSPNSPDQVDLAEKMDQKTPRSVKEAQGRTRARVSVVMNQKDCRQ